jgi:uncharacterized membrane protein
MSSSSWSPLFGRLSLFALAGYLVVGLSDLPLWRRLLPPIVLPYDIDKFNISLITSVMFNLCHHTAVDGIRYSMIWLVTFTVIVGIFEVIGLSTGAIFGSYTFSSTAFGPRVFNGILPIGVPFAWYAMGYPCYIIATTFAVRRSTSSSAARLRPLETILVAAVTLTCSDICGDPLLSSSGGHHRYRYDHINDVPHWLDSDWTWNEAHLTPYVWHGVPIHNFIGWFITSLVAFTSCIAVTSKIPSITQEKDGSKSRWWLSPAYAGMLPITMVLATGVFYATHGTIPSSIQNAAIFLMILPSAASLAAIIHDYAPPLDSKRS